MMALFNRKQADNQASANALAEQARLLRSLGMRRLSHYGGTDNKARGLLAKASKFEVRAEEFRHVAACQDCLRA